MNLSTATDNSQVQNILRECWNDYRNDPYPHDRRMKVLEEKEVKSFSTENIRFFINEIVRRFAQDGVYFEVGIYRGGSLLSAGLFNPSTRCIGIDDFSGHNPIMVNEKVLNMNLDKFGNPSNIEYYNMDYQDAISMIFNNEPDLKVSVYYYDGDHSYEHQLNGLRAILPYLAPKCILLVDDVNKSDVVNANNKFMEENPDFQSACQMRTKGWGDCSTNWWEGFQVLSRGI